MTQLSFSSPQFTHRLVALLLSATAVSSCGEGQIVDSAAATYIIDSGPCDDICLKEIYDSDGVILERQDYLYEYSCKLQHQNLDKNLDGEYDYHKQVVRDIDGMPLSATIDEDNNGTCDIRLQYQYSHELLLLHLFVFDCTTDVLLSVQDYYYSEGLLVLQRNTSFAPADSVTSITFEYDEDGLSTTQLLDINSDGSIDVSISFEYDDEARMISSSTDLGHDGTIELVFRYYYDCD